MTLKGRRRGAAALAIGLSLALGACAIEPPVPSPVLSKAEPAELTTTPTYMLSPGDEIELVFLRTPELNVRETISPSGDITLLGGLEPKRREVAAAFMTTTELAASLSHIYADELKNPTISVIVRTYGSNRVYVAGEVGHPGQIPLSGNMTALQAILSAEGFKSTARLDDVLIIRPTGRRQATWRILNLRKSLRKSDASDDFVLQPHDIIYVPRSPIGNVDEFVDLYVKRLLPVSVGLQPSF